MKFILIFFILASCADGRPYITEESKFNSLKAPVILRAKDVEKSGINAHSSVMVIDSTGRVVTFSNCTLAHIISTMNIGDTIK